MVDSLGRGWSRRLCPRPRVPQPSGCVDSIQKRFKELLRGAVPKFPSGTSVELVGSSEDILVDVLFKRCPLGDKSPKQAVVALVLGALPGGVGMSEEGVGSPLLYLGKVSKLASVVHCNGLKDLGEVFAILVMELIHEVHDRLAGFSRDNLCNSTR